MKLKAIRCSLLIVFALVKTVASGIPRRSRTCHGAPTSEGPITLQDGDFACAALGPGENFDDLGKKYVFCVGGYPWVMPCPPSLRWDTKYNLCNWPSSATCFMGDRSGSFTNIFDPPSTTTESSTDTFDTSTTASSTHVYNTPSTNTASSTNIYNIPSTTTASSTHIYNTPSTTTGSSTNIFDSTTSSWTTTDTGEVLSCTNVATSEGLRTLENGGTACAALSAGETEADKGKRWIQCANGVPVTRDCSTGLRFDTATGTCNWPDLSTCALPDNGSPTSQTTQSPATTRPPVTNAPTTKPPVTNAPTTQKPTPGTDAPTPTGPCNPTTCKLPDCFCYGQTPSGIPLEDMPQFLMLTFDDTVSPYFWKDYFKALLHDNDFKLFNPTGCPIKAGLYVSHADTDYSLVKALWEKGHEIASHTINHRLPDGQSSADYPDMVAEIQGLKNKVFDATQNQTLVNSMVGFRAPYLRVAHDTMYDVLRDYGFKYDTSILNTLALQGRTPIWPYTLDYVIPDGECINLPCPTKPYPGMWEVPLNGWVGDNGQGCSMADACVVGSSQYSATQQQWEAYFKRNFDDYFYPVKVPAPLFIHGWMFINFQNSWPALTKWLQDTMSPSSYGNVWMVTPSQVIQWMKNPLSHSQMVAQNWGC